jgi:hypothetical protein
MHAVKCEKALVFGWISLGDRSTIGSLKLKHISENGVKRKIEVNRQAII